MAEGTEGTTETAATETTAPETTEAATTETAATEATTTETQEAPAEQSNAVDLKAALGELKDILKPRAATQTPEQIEAAVVKLEQETGFTRQQLVAQERVARNAALQQNLELGRELGKMKAEKELGAYSADFLKEVEAEISKMEPQFQVNPTVWINTARYIKGANIEKILAKHKPKSEPSTVVGGGMVTPTRGGSTGGGAPAKKYDAGEQEMIARYFRGDAKAYEAAKNRKSVGDDNQIKSKSGVAMGLADSALARMTEGNS